MYPIDCMVVSSELIEFMAAIYSAIVFYFSCTFILRLDSLCFSLAEKFDRHASVAARSFLVVTLREGYFMYTREELVRNTRVSLEEGPLTGQVFVSFKGGTLYLYGYPIHYRFWLTNESISLNIIIICMFLDP